MGSIWNSNWRNILDGNVNRNHYHLHLPIRIIIVQLPEW